MLETLPNLTVPTNGDNLSTMETISRKERLAGLAWLIAGEGCISARIDDKNSNGKGKQMDLKVKIVNTDMEIIKYASEVLVENKIGFYYATCGWVNPALEIAVSGYGRIQRLLSLILPYLVGSKRKQAELMLQLIARRQSQHKLAMDDAETVELTNRIIAAKKERTSPLACIRAANQVLSYRNPQRLYAPQGSHPEDIV